MRLEIFKCNRIANCNGHQTALATRVHNSAVDAH